MRRVADLVSTWPRFATLMATGFASTVAAQEDVTGFSFDAELGPVWIARNDVRIPGEGGTRFDMTDLIGTGPELSYRLGGLWQVNDRHGLRLVLAPLEIDGSGVLEQETEFAGETFAAGNTGATYKFNAYKLSYRYTFDDRGAWRWRIGLTAIIRDANVELRQGSLRANDDDVGFVPTLHVSGTYRISDRWRFSLDFDGLAGGPGRLFDVALEFDYELTEQWAISAGYRAFEGGVDTDDVYNFGWFNYAVLGVDYRFGSE